MSNMTVRSASWDLLLLAGAAT